MGSDTSVGGSNEERQNGPEEGPMTYSQVPVPEPSPSRVLLVDDDRSIRHALYTLLESEGYEVLAAGNGLDGLAVFRQSTRPIELLVTDYNMPRMSGLELARECSYQQRTVRAVRFRCPSR